MWIKHRKINQRACYNRIWSWSPMPCEKHGPRAPVTTKKFGFRSRFLSTESLRPCFSHGMGDHDQILQYILEEPSIFLAQMEITYYNCNPRVWCCRFIVPKQNCPSFPIIDRILRPSTWYDIIKDKVPTNIPFIMAINLVLVTQLRQVSYIDVADGYPSSSVDRTLHSTACCWVQRMCLHDDVIKWKHSPRNWPFVREIHGKPSVRLVHKDHGQMYTVSQYGTVIC